MSLMNHMTLMSLVYEDRASGLGSDRSGSQEVFVGHVPQKSRGEGLEGLEGL